MKVDGDLHVWKDSGSLAHAQAHDVIMILILALESQAQVKQLWLSSGHEKEYRIKA
jgi:hypothetical protein